MKQWLSFNNPVVWIIIAVFTFGSAAWWWHHRDGHEILFRTALVKRGDIAATISATGTLEPVEVVDIGAQVAGQISSFGKDVDGMFCPCEPVTVTATKALRDLGLAGGKVKVVGFDSGTQSVVDLEKGDLQALVVQSPLRMGYLGVMTLVQHLQGKTVEKRIDTGVTLATHDNMKDTEVAELLHPPLEKYLKE